VGTVMSGLLLGILLARNQGLEQLIVVSIPVLVGIYPVAMALIALVLARCLPRYQQSVGLSYTQLLRSVLGLFGEEPALRLRAFLGATVFAAFSVLWTSMAFLLAGPDYGYGEAAIGLFGLAGAAGALAASAVGHLADRGHGDRATTLGWWLLLLSWGALYFAPLSLVALILGVLALDLAVQGVHVSNQGAIYRIRPEARNRLTAAYMTCYFIGGAAGSLVSAAAYGAAGWSGVCLCGGIVSLAGLAAWLGGSRLHKAVSGA